MIKKPLVAGLGAVATLAGLVWVGQGLNLIPGSFMTGDPTWVVMGAISLLLGVVLIVLSTRGRSRHDPNGPPGQH